MTEQSTPRLQIGTNEKIKSIGSYTTARLQRKALQALAAQRCQYKLLQFRSQEWIAL